MQARGLRAGSKAVKIIGAGNALGGSLVGNPAQRKEAYRKLAKAGRNRQVEKSAARKNKPEGAGGEKIARNGTSCPRGMSRPRKAGRQVRSPSGWPRPGR